MLAGLSLPMMVLLLIGGVALDLLLGEARRWHPLVGFGRLAGWLERLLNRGGLRIARGAVAWLLAVVPAVVMAAWLNYPPMHAVLLYFALGLRSLREHNLAIAEALFQNQLPQARALTARIVSRDTADASPSELAKASAESLLENGNDAVFGTLFWFAVGGGAGALLFRLANTLDAMWGYRSERYLYFGRLSARIDDGLNYIPARLTALSYVVLAGNAGLAWRCWRRQARTWPSPNAGPVMASGAGGLGIALGGEATYDGVREWRPLLGQGRPAEPRDIARAWQLVAITTWLWIALLVAAAGFNLAGGGYA